MKLISMEHNEQWYHHQISVLPEKFSHFVEIHHSPMSLYQHAFIRGTTYKDIPDYPYDFVFVDGPSQDFAEIGLPKMCNMSLIQVVERSEKPVFALIDKRLLTVVALNNLFTPGKVKYNHIGGIGIVEDVTRHDLIVLDPKKLKSHLLRSLVQGEFRSPFFQSNK